jgi:hypothetical protein
MSEPLSQAIEMMADAGFTTVPHAIGTLPTGRASASAVSRTRPTTSIPDCGRSTPPSLATMLRPPAISLAEQLERHQLRKAEALKVGVPALRRLIAHSQSGSIHARNVAKFLAGLYNKPQFDLAGLRGLDEEVFEDVVCVLRLDAIAGERAVQNYIADGQRVFDSICRLHSLE